MINKRIQIIKFPMEIERKRIKLRSIIMTRMMIVIIIQMTRTRRVEMKMRANQIKMMRMI